MCRLISCLSKVVVCSLLFASCFFVFTGTPRADEDYAWRSDPYRAPDYEGFFPDDPEGGVKLEGLWKSKDKDSRSDEEIMSAMKNGIRNAKHTMPIIRWFGNKYIWGKDPQNPQAIEIMYHLVGGPDKYNPVYFGLSVVQAKTPAIIRTLVGLAMESEDPNQLHRIAWGCSSQKDELLKFLKPYLDDPETREHAEVLEKIFKGELKAFEWSRNKAKAKAEAKFTDQLPEIREALLHGDSEQRKETLDLINRNAITLIMDDSFIPAWATAASDPDVQIRRNVARTFGNAWLWSKKEQNPDAIDVIMKLTKDSDREVKSRALYFGLSVIWDPSEEVVRRLVEMALEDQEPNWYGRALWGLRRQQAKAEKILLEFMKDFEDNPGQAAIALDTYRKIFDKDPPVENIAELEKLVSISQHYVVVFAANDPVEDESALVARFKETYRGDLNHCRMMIRHRNDKFSAIVFVPSWDAKEAVKKSLEDSDKFKILQVEQANKAQMETHFQNVRDWLEDEKQ